MAKIEANSFCRRTQFQIEKGRRYRFTASGQWSDSRHKCTATGYTEENLRRYEWLRRDRHAKWFSLIGRIDNKRSTQFDIGRLIETDAIYTATATGTLYCFANDVWFMYWNNRGHIDLELQAIENDEDPRAGESVDTESVGSDRHAIVAHQS